MQRKHSRKLVSVIAFLLSVMFIAVTFGPVPVKAAGNKMVRVSTAKALNKAINDPDVLNIIFRTNAYIKVTIKANSAASSKCLTIDSPNADVTNKATFDTIFLEKCGNYVDSANGNTYEIYDRYAIESFTVAKKKTVKKITYINPYQSIEKYYCLRKGAKVEELNLIYANGGNPGFSVYDPQTGIMNFNYTNQYDANVSLTYKLDKSGRIIYFKNNHPEFGCEYSFEYDSNGNLIKETFDDMVGPGTTTYEYNSANKLTKAFNSIELMDEELNYTYDKKGNLITITRTNYLTKETNVEAEYTYDKNGRILTSKEEGGYSTVKQTFKYNSKGFLTSFTEKQIGGPYDGQKTVIAYKYNKAGDLIKITLNDNGKKTVTKYKYDEFGNKI